MYTEQRAANRRPTKQQLIAVDIAERRLTSETRLLNRLVGGNYGRLELSGINAIIEKQREIVERCAVELEETEATRDGIHGSDVTQTARVRLLKRLAGSVRKWLRAESLRDREPMQFNRSDARHFSGEPGLRVASISINMGRDNSRLLKKLDMPTLYQLIPWGVGGYKPAANLDGRRVRIEAPYPENIQSLDVRLSSIGEGRPHDGFIVGPNQHGVTVALSVADVYHALISGATRSGKSTTMRSIGAQLAQENSVIMALIDGDGGTGLGMLSNARNLAGPLAYTRDDTLNALGWAISEMDRRKCIIREDRNGEWWEAHDPTGPPHVVLLWDEFQENMHDKEIMRAFEILATQGAKARVHIFGGTQTPSVKKFGSEGGDTRDQFGLRLGHAVEGFAASNAAMGGNWPRADNLLGRGDAYVKAKLSTGKFILERVQVAHMTPAELREIPKSAPRMESWPVFDTERLGYETGEARGRKRKELTADQIARAIYGARQAPQWGRDVLGRETGLTSSGRIDRLLKIGRKVAEKLSVLGV